MKPAIWITLGLAISLAATVAAQAKGGRDPTFILKHPRSDFEKRYPGDQYTERGPVRVTGPDRGPYIESCYWVARDTFLGLPWGFTQYCGRRKIRQPQ